MWEKRGVLFRAPGKGQVVVNSPSLLSYESQRGPQETFLLTEETQKSHTRRGAVGSPCPSCFLLGPWAFLVPLPIVIRGIFLLIIESDNLKWGTKLIPIHSICLNPGGGNKVISFISLPLVLA